MKKIAIAFFDTKNYDSEIFDAVNKSFGYEIKYIKSHLTKDTVILAQGCQAICAFVNDQITKEIISAVEKMQIKVIALRSAGYNNVDLSAAYGHVHVLRVPAYSPHAVAEHAIALILTLNRKTHKAYSRTRDSNFNIAGLMGFDLYGKTLGVIGTGKIGKIFAQIMQGFGMNMLAYDVYPDKNFAKENNITYTTLEKIYKDSDVISLHCPLTKESHHLINKKSISQMKNGVMIINTSRGALIDSKALIDGLKTKKIGSAGLDVYEEESDYFFEDFSNEIIDDDVLARLLTFPNVLITSHQAFFTKEALHNIAETTLNNIKDFFGDKPLVNEICYQCGEKTACSNEKKGRCF